MPSFKPLSSALALVTLSAAPGAAELTGPQVWSDWKTYLGSFGYETSATEVLSGDILTVSDITMVIDVPDGDGEVMLEMGTLAFIENSDGTVTVDWPEQLPIRYSADIPGQADDSGTLMLTQVEADMVASGTPDALSYAYSAKELSINLQDVTVAGAVTDPDTYTALIEMTDVAGTSRTTGDDLRTYAQDFTVADVSYTFASRASDNPEDTPGDFRGTLSGLEMSSTSVLPATPGDASFAALTAEGAEVTGSMIYASGSANIEIETPTGPFVTQTQSDGGTFDISMTQEGVSYTFGQTNLAANVTTTSFPLPLSVNIAQSAFNLGIPIGVSDTPQPFAIGFKFGDFTLSDIIWSLFDPNGQLPRDPATLELGVTGTARVLADLFDPEVLAAQEASAELTSLDIGTLLLDMIGARLSGNGSFSFDTTDTQTFDGMPRPEGALELQLEGGNALLDKLVAIGLLPQEQAMGVRMMMGLFSVPQGNDTLTSKIEVNAEGHVLANGQRLR